ncbi:MAG TPA: tyrosine-protein phosphatase, partial [Anaerolineales bacterium]|nr:tyrosine-protein phosphatase [Anaerolineales bacterium]
HCTAGKDRTGFAAASLLRILGVSQEVILEDYLLTNHYLLSAYKWNLMFAGLVKGRHFANYIRGFLQAHPDYLTAAFKAAEQAHGSFEDYVRAGLGLNDKDVNRLKDMYLE